MSVMLSIPIGTVEQEKEQPSRTYGLDLDKGRIVGMVDGLEAVNQAIRKHLFSPRFRCLIYDNQYGSELKQEIIAGGVSREYIEAELPRMVKDALSVDSRILDVYDFSFSFENEKAFVSFKANTVFGETTAKEVLGFV